MSNALKVYQKCCNQCLFSKNRIVSDDRKNQLLRDILKNDHFFVCHKSTLRGQNVCCRAFYDRHNLDVRPLRLAQLVNGVQFVPLPKEKEGES